MISPGSVFSEAGQLVRRTIWCANDETRDESREAGASGEVRLDLTARRWSGPFVLGGLFVIGQGDPRPAVRCCRAQSILIWREVDAAARRGTRRRSPRDAPRFIRPSGETRPRINTIEIDFLFARVRLTRGTCIDGRRIRQLHSCFFYSSSKIYPVHDFLISSIETSFFIFSALVLFASIRHLALVRSTRPTLETPAT